MSETVIRLQLQTHLLSLLRSTYIIYNKPRNTETRKRDVRSRDTLEYFDIQKNRIKLLISDPFGYGKKCWWCGYIADIGAVGCPVKYNRKDDIYETEGCFCDEECMKAYACEQVRNNYAVYKDSLMFISSICGFNLKAARSWKLLKEYGGCMDHKEFKSIKRMNYPEVINSRTRICMFEEK